MVCRDDLYYFIILKILIALRSPRTPPKKKSEHAGKNEKSNFESANCGTAPKHNLQQLATPPAFKFRAQLSTEEGEPRRRMSDRNQPFDVLCLVVD